MRWGLSRVIRRRRVERRSVWRLSKLATHGSGIPSSVPRDSSLVRPRTVRVPTAAVLAASEQLRRYREVPRSWQNVLIGLRYLSLDRIFERSRLAALVAGPLPSMPIEELVRSAFELPSPQALPAPDALSLARFAG